MTPVLMAPVLITLGPTPLPAAMTVRPEQQEYET